MSGKHRHGKRKHYRSGKKIVKPTTQPAAPVAVTTPEAPKVASPPPKVPAATRAASDQYPYIASELRRIGILAGAIFVILIVLFFILS